MLSLAALIKDGSGFLFSGLGIVGLVVIAIVAVLILLPISFGD